MNRERILITGVKGFIPSKLMERLAQEGHEVVGIDILDGIDICNFQDMYNVIEGVDSVFHLAAVSDLNWARANPIKTMEINLKGTWNISYACQLHHAKLLFASTACVYGNQKIHPSTEQTLPNPSEIYAHTKLAGESIIKGFNYTYGLQYNIMRFATIYGEGARPALATHIFLGQALRNVPITIHGNGEQTRTLTYIDDLIDSIVALYNSGRMNDTWNLTAEEEISVNQMAETIKRITQSKSIIVNIPQRIGQTYKEAVSAQKMWNEVGWKARVSWDEGIKRMYKWFLNTNQLQNVYAEPKGE